MSHKYHSLLVRAGRASDWQIHFGDYEKHVVVQEQADICANGDYRKINTKIIATGDTQGDIDTAVKLLNAPFDPPFTIITMTPDNVEHIHNIIAEALGEPKLNRKS